MYSQLLPLSSIHYFNTWRWPQADHNPDSRNSSVSGPTLNGSISDEDTDSGFYDAAITAAHSEQDMDEDREWGLFDEDEPSPDAKVSVTMESLAAPSNVGVISIGANAGANVGNNASRLQAPSFTQLPRDRRSSTGSLAHHNTSPCGMEAFVANRRGSASSVSSSQSQTPTNLLGHGASASFAEGYMTPLQLQPMTPIPFINKRSSSQAYRQKVQQQQQQQRNVSPVPPLHQGMVVTGSNAALVFKETVEESVGVGGVHPLQGKANPLPPPPVDYLTMNMSFLEIPDGAIASQLTCIEFLLFRKLKVTTLVLSMSETGGVLASSCEIILISLFNVTGRSLAKRHVAPGLEDEQGVNRVPGVHRPFQLYLVLGRHHDFVTGQGQEQGQDDGEVYLHCKGKFNFFRTAGISSV